MNAFTGSYYISMGFRVLKHRVMSGDAPPAGNRFVDLLLSVNFMIPEGT